MLACLAPSSSRARTWPMMTPRPRTWTSACASAHMCPADGRCRGHTLLWGCRSQMQPGELRSQARPITLPPSHWTDREFVLTFSIINEGHSFLLPENLAKYLPKVCAAYSGQAMHWFRARTLMLAAFPSLRAAILPDAHPSHFPPGAGHSLWPTQVLQRRTWQTRASLRPTSSTPSTGEAHALLQTRHAMPADTALWCFMSKWPPHIQGPCTREHQLTLTPSTGTSTATCRALN